MYTVFAGNTSEKCERDDVFEVCERLRALGPLSIHDGTGFILVDGVKNTPSTHPAAPVSAPELAPAPEPRTGYLAPLAGYGAPQAAAAVALATVPSPAPAFSTFGAGNQVVDESARARIEAQHEALKLHGIAVDASEQLFATGTRMMREGYGIQAARKSEHDAKEPVRLAGLALRDAVVSEKREDRVIRAGELARSIMVNGKITCLDGLQLTEQAIRGLALRLESPMLGYILGLRNRIAEEASKGDSANRDMMKNDRRTMANVIAHECDRNGDIELKLRTRQSVGDVFACVSPAYTPADAPEVLAQILGKLPEDARGTWSYDPTSTAWELRADVWTPTPVAQQAVGEAFSGYVSFQSRDNGSSSFRGGGGILLLRCLNASTYAASSSDVKRRHMGEIMVDIDAMLAGSLQAITALCGAWGVNRQTEVRAPDSIPLSVAIPGFWSYLLRDRSSELAGVLPGRSAKHVEGLTAAFEAERRDESKLVRADFAQGWTRYIQDQPTPVRRDAEQAIGNWLVNARPVGLDLRDVRA